MLEDSRRKDVAKKCMAKLTNLTNLKRNFANFAKIVMQKFALCFFKNRSFCFLQ